MNDRLKKGWVHKRGNIYWIRYYDKKGVRHDESTKNEENNGRNKQYAENLLRQRQVEALQEKTPEKGMNKILLSELLEHLKAETKGKAPRVDHVLRIIPDKRASEVTTQDVAKYVKVRQSEDGYGGGKVKDATLALELAGLRRAFKVGIEDKLINKMPVFSKRKGTMVGTDTDLEKGFFNHDQFIAFVDAYRADEKSDPSVLAGIRFAYETSWREDQVYSMEWSWIKEDHIVPDAKKVKTRVSESFPITAPIQTILEEQRKITGGKGLVFPGPKGEIVSSSSWWFRSAWNKALKNAGLPFRGYKTNKDNDDRPMVTFHGLRHSVATQLAIQGESVKNIQAVTGHKTKVMVDRYVHANKERAKEALSRLEKFRNGDKIEKVKIPVEALEDLAGDITLLIEEAWRRGRDNEPFAPSVNLLGTLLGTSNLLDSPKSQK